MLLNEKDSRTTMEMTLQSNLLIGDFPQDEHPCHYCIDFCYLSLLECKKCQINYCIRHGKICGCDSVRLVYRFSTRVLTELLGKLNLALRASQVINQVFCVQKCE